MDQISALLTKLGIHRTCLGYRYIYYILQLSLENEDYLLRVTTLYELTGSKFKTAPYNVEACIRSAIANCWTHGNKNYLIKIARYDLTDKPTISEFLDILYCHLISDPE